MTPPFETSPALRGEGFVHGFFGRRGGMSTGIFESLNCGLGSTDVRAHAIENRRRAVEAVLPGGTLITLSQAHSANVITVLEPWPAATDRQNDKNPAPVADAMVTNRAGIALGILAADCVPVLLADAQARVIGAAHAGWRGAFAGIIEATVDAMEALGARRDRIAAAIGPGISGESYEVGPEFRARFVAADERSARLFKAAARPDHFLFDLPAFAIRRLDRAGVQAVDLGICTYRRNADYFSYRGATHRGEGDYGRNVSIIALAP